MKHLLCLSVLFLGALMIQPARAHVSMGGPSVTYGQNLEDNGQIGVGGWGLFLGSQIRMGPAAYEKLKDFYPDGGSVNDFNM